MQQPDEKEYELDPYHQAQEDAEKKLINDAVDEDTPDDEENPEASAQVVDEDPENTFSNWTHKVPVVGQIKWGLDTAALGVGDFASDAIGLVPWLKPVDDWWDANSPRSTNPAQKLLRDASSVILPSIVGGSWLVGGAKAAVATRAITLPKYAHVVGSIAAYTGVDTGVAMISSHSKTDDNMAATLNNWLGWGLPWATRPGDDPDVRWKKNVYESAGLAGGVELLGAAFMLGKKAKLFPRDAGADELINAKRTSLSQYDEPLSAAVDPARVARDQAHYDEMVDAIKKDPSGENYNAFVNDLGDDSVSKAVQNIDADPLEAKLHHAQMQHNIGTYNGRAAAVAPEPFHKSFAKALDGNTRAQHLDQLFDSFKPDFDAAVAHGKTPVKITAEEMNRGVDNLTQALYGSDISFKEFQVIVEDMKITSFDYSLFPPEAMADISTTFNKAYNTLFDPNQRRASAMLAQNFADNVTDAATAAKLLGDNVDTSRQFEMMFKKLNLLDSELKANRYITSKAGEYRQIKRSGNVQAAVAWINKQTDEFDGYLKRIKNTNAKFEEELLAIAKEDPRYFHPLKEAFAATNGNVDQLDKLHKYAEKNIGLIKKGFLDQDPEVPSMIVRGLHGARINSILSGLSPIRAAVGNSMMTAIKPASIFAGAVMQGDAAALKRASYTFGGISENVKRALKVMRDEWNLAKQFPEEAMMRGRSDMRLAQMNKLETLEGMADIWRQDGEHGKVAMWNMARGLTWWNKQPFVKFGTNALYAIDGFTNSFMASGMARARAYDELFTATKGTPDLERFNDLQRKLYDNAFDNTGLLTDEAAKHASREIALNLDNATVQQFERFLDHVPAARGLFLFPRTGVNALELGWSFNPVSNLGPAMTRARRALGAKTKSQKLAVLAEHGIDAAQDADLAFQTLKSEYLGRQIMGSTVVMGVGLWALEGNLTGNGPQDAAERRRMLSMGWQPNSIRNPITGEWRSYKGFAPFDSLMGLTADIVYQANRADQPITEDFFRKVAHSIGMNITNDTFVSGFEPLVGLVSGDAGAWTRFFAQQTDMLVPYKGMRTILNNAITPQLKDVENDFFAYLKNSNKFIFGNELEDMLDIYTGKPIRYHEPLTAAFNSVLPFFKSNGSTEPWRQWLMSTGWDGIQRIRRNKYTNQPLSPEDRQFMNNWIAKNGNLKGQIQKLMTEGDGFWGKKLEEFKKARGLKGTNAFPIRNMILYKELDRIHDRVFDGAWHALEAYNEQFTTIGRESKHRNHLLQKGKFGEAGKSSERLRNLQQMRK